jgi:hypothetical protein
MDVDQINIGSFHDNHQASDDPGESISGLAREMPDDSDLNEAITD